MAFENIASPPVGKINSIADIQSALTAKIKETPTGEWIMAAGYDDSLLVEQRHPTKFDLDKISTAHPIMLLHVSAHLMVCNSKCLEIVGYTAETENPKGGIIQRIEGSDKPNGILEETPIYEIYFKHLPIHDIETRLELLQQAQDYFARFGITTVQDGAVSLKDLQTLTRASEENRLKLDIVAYPLYPYAETLLTQYPFSPSYQNHYRVGGVKLQLDGSPQGKTAWLTKPYHVVPEGRESN